LQKTAYALEPGIDMVERRPENKEKSMPVFIPLTLEAWKPSRRLLAQLGGAQGLF
jgi:hypothetical protein